MAVDYRSSLARYRRYLQTVQNKPLWQESLYLILSLLLVMVLVIWALRPTLVTIAKLLAERKQYLELEKRMDEKIELIREAQNVYLQVQDRLEVLNMAVPKTADWSGVATGVQQSATDSGLVTKSFGVNLGKDVEFSMATSGAYDGIKRFITGLGKSSRIIDIKSLSIDKQVGGELTLSLQGAAVYMPEN
ncbi:hypothetical protein A3D85_03095 [Candidatus Amesbacteria bacterium RIFCSPHIGHO2_02_FULL_47_9]|uniref:Uncharacterized protein n=1 Tax=Candidatus Amesbacteria bacterium RIFCSPHIGHO2_01_FULL_48_32b TaxID=1797253 RepID=A0A1F4YH26_9BACT|nr:MAG: hypothetical protein A2876_00720 [Candidatus Amesbacteria bacterium RIFCSPHIGHO2_01_FULL_48_32b]OGD02247.1 MAG: hypothetical protein A3D85_03095 [Candidatus Amesbacteria bacterium RIFCSPHIGHO2_02_FULL_47_9]OGD07460.1 MAG: hypothetical protein A2899_04115 [Candidatus Amesbacteria bacterium RIFCSPLOWO2_01_FULL_49_25]